MTYSERQVRNSIIVNLSRSGLTQAQIAASVNIGQRMVSTILSKSTSQLPLTSQPSGRLVGLDSADLIELSKFLALGAEYYGFTGNYWTQKRVGYVIHEKFQIQYSDKQVGRILDKINWTRQKPQKKDKRQNSLKVEKWQKEDLPSLKKKP
jgi:transposase